MRLRNVKSAHDRIDSFEHVVQEPKAHKGKWHEFFGNENPIYIEIGMGKGQLLMEHALNNPDINYIGFEKFTVVLVKALDKYRRTGHELTNLCVIREFAEEILDIFDENEINRVYLNFSDPWPKDRHYKRRLTYRGFLEKYNHIMKPQGKVIFKTDNDDLFEFSVDEMSAMDMDIHKLTRDLHNSDFLEGNIMTEYEAKFHKKGKNINMVEGSFK